MENIKTILMHRNGVSAKEAENLIDNARNQLHEYLAEGNTEAAGDICEEFFGLEPDYIMELI